MASPAAFLPFRTISCDYGFTGGNTSQNEISAAALAAFGSAEAPGVKTPLSPPSLNAAMAV